ncbi:MAG TPA: hypothetical protein VNN80_15830 [Polyangiaceae bacterium]|nr:hypothetical protein [Polyangiaceae bacterium]
MANVAHRSDRARRFIPNGGSRGAGRRRARWLAAVTLSLLAGCGGGESEDASEGGVTEDPASNTTTFDVTWREDAVVVDDVAAVQNALVRADYATGTLVFDSGFSAMDRFSVGDATLIGGVGIFRIMGVQETAEGTALNVEEASLTDVIEDGTIAFRRSFLSAADDEKVGLGDGADETTAIRSLRQGLTLADGLKYNGNVGGVQLDFSLTPQGNRTLDMSLQGNYGNGPAKLSARLAGTLRGLTTDVDIRVEARSLTAYRVETSQIDGDVTIEASAAALGNIEETIRVPARVALPVVVGGIPFHIDIGGGFELASSLNTQGTAEFKGKAKFRGAVGLDISAGSVSVNDTTLESETSFDSGTLSSNVTVGLRVTLIFPEVALGIGMQQAVSASGFIRFKTEAISNLTVQQRTAVLLPVPVVGGETRSCLESSVSVGATYGGDAKFLGITLAEGELPLATLFGKTERNGDGCE